MDREIRVCGGESSNEMVLECAYCSFGRIASMHVGGGLIGSQF